MLDVLNSGMRSDEWPVVITQHSCYAAEMLAEALVKHCGWSPDAIYLRTGKRSSTQESDSMDRHGYSSSYLWNIMALVN